MNYELEMLNISKSFPGIKANDNISLKVEKGTIHALLGENGAGKSTLMSILFGLYDADEGIIKIRGEEVKITNPNDATRLKIGMVHQHFKLVDNFTVSQNIILGSEPTTKLGIVDLKTVNKEIAQISNQYKLAVDPKAKIEDISVGMQQRVEILKMLYRDADILIFDEPSAVLIPQEIHELMNIMKDLAQAGKTIILITHKLNEIMEVADKCTVLRRGRYVDTVNVKDVTERQLAELMVGRELEFMINKPQMECGETYLEVRNLDVVDGRGVRMVQNLSLDVHCGEIVGVAGIDGNGQDELVYAITGLMKATGGSITLKGIDITDMSVKKRNELGIGHIPSDRHKHGLILDFALKENLIIHGFDDEFSKKGVINIKEVESYADRLIKEFDVRSSNGSDSITRSMSGGNQQKAIIAREIDRSPGVLIIVQPTRGLDVGAIEYIHNRIINERNHGKAIMLVSFELDEILALSDRIAVMYNGKLSGVVENKNITENEIGLMMIGSSLEEARNAE